MKQHFAAPWGLKLKVITAVFGLLFAIGLIEGGAGAAAGLLAVAVVAAAFGVRGYGVGDGQLVIYRPGWTTRFDLSRLRSAEVLGAGLPGSLRMFGVGGLFAFVGYFRHPEAGWYKAYATDGSRSVFLDFGDERILVTPDAPTEFVAAVQFQSHRVA